MQQVEELDKPRDKHGNDKRRGNVIVISVWVTEQVAADLAATAVLERTSKSEVIRRALARELKQ